MFKREKKVYLELTDAERRLVRMYLMGWRNKLTAQGRDAGRCKFLNRRNQ